MFTKKDLVNEVAGRFDEYKKKEIGEITDTVIDVLKETLAKGEKVSIHKFGIFDIVERAARNGRNPQTGEAMVFPAKKVVKFKPSKEVKESVNA